MNLKELFSSFENKKSQIRKRLKEFKGVWLHGSNERVFSELCFCILTPQSEAFSCNAAVSRCLLDGTIFFGSEKQLREKIFPIRFYKNKSKYIFGARKIFSDSGTIVIKKILSEQGIQKNPLQAREWLVGNVKGIGYKEASHFLRNIGFGSNIAILDRHVLKNLKTLGVMKSLPKTLNKKNYLTLEKKMLHFSKKVSIPLPELDLLFWSNATGKIFK